MFRYQNIFFNIDRESKLHGIKNENLFFFLSFSMMNKRINIASKQFISPQKILRMNSEIYLT